MGSGPGSAAPTVTHSLAAPRHFSAEMPITQRNFATEGLLEDFFADAVDGDWLGAIELRRQQDFGAIFLTDLEQQLEGDATLGGEQQQRSAATSEPQPHTDCPQACDDDFAGASAMGKPMAAPK